MLTIQKTSEQFQLASALAEIFEGKNIRFWLKGEETWFVAKDVVEAAGGIWQSQNFKKALGEGAFITTPLQTEGGVQQITICNQRTALKWLTLSRLPAAAKLADLVWEIMDRVMKGQKVNAEAVSDSQSKREKAVLCLKKEWNPLQEMLKVLGYSEGAIQAEFLENVVMTEAKFNETILSDSFKRQLSAGDEILLDKSVQAQARITSVGGTGVKATTLATKLGVKPKDVNDAFEALGWAKRAENAIMLPLAPGRKFCYVKEVTRGKYLGGEIVETWNEALVWQHLVDFFKKPSTTQN